MSQYCHSKFFYLSTPCRTADVFSDKIFHLRNSYSRPIPSWVGNVFQGPLGRGLLNTKILVYMPYVNEFKWIANNNKSVIDNKALCSTSLCITFYNVRETVNKCYHCFMFPGACCVFKCTKIIWHDIQSLNVITSLKVIYQRPLIWRCRQQTYGEMAIDITMEKLKWSLLTKTIKNKILFLA